MRLANMAFEELTEAMNRGWGTRNSTVGQLLQVERSGIEPPAVDPKRCRRSSTPTSRSEPLRRSAILQPEAATLRGLLVYVIIRLIGQKAHGCYCIPAVGSGL